MQCFGLCIVRWGREEVVKDGMMPCEGIKLGRLMLSPAMGMACRRGGVGFPCHACGTLSVHEVSLSFIDVYGSRVIYVKSLIHAQVLSAHRSLKLEARIGSKF